jgi:predicted MFS family arabinose efflux permease
VCNDRAVHPERDSLRRPRQVAIAAAAALALADGSIVVLALPELLSALHTTVDGVAAVIGVYTAALAAALFPAERLRRRIGSARLGTAGLATFAGASLVCALARSLPLMLVMRALQAAGGAAALVAAFAFLRAGTRRGGGGRLWMLAAIGGAAAGPALGGALTQAFSWSAIFFAQVPIALAGAVACASTRETVEAEPTALAPTPTAAAPSDETQPASRRSVAAVALLSAALTAVLFLLVLVIVAGWSFSPLAGAAILTVLPLAAIAALRVPGDPRVRAVAGSLLVAGGVAALAPMATASAWWTIAPELAAGVGMGLALPALSESLLPERTPADAARVLTARHVGITVALVLLAPVIANRLDSAIQQAREREVAVMLDAGLSPVSKVTLVGKLVGTVGTVDPRGDLDKAFISLRPGVTGEQRVALDELQKRSDDTVITAVRDTFWRAFLIAAAFAVAAALALLPGTSNRTLVVAAAIVALLVPIATTAVSLAVAPEPVKIADPCHPRQLPQAGGIAGTIQSIALRGLDVAACHFGSSREQLVLALTNSDDARRYQRQHGVDPRSLSSVISSLLWQAATSQSLGQALQSLLQ